MLGYMTNLYFSDHKLAIEIDENGRSEKNIQYKIKRQKAIEQEPGCEFIRIEMTKKVLIFMRLSIKDLDTSNI